MSGGAGKSRFTLLAIVAAIAVTAYLLGRSAPVSKAQSPTHEAKLPESNSTARAEIPSRAVEIPEPATTPARAMATTAPRATAGPPERLPLPADHTEDQRLLVETTFAREPIDTAWAREARSTISGGLQKVTSDKDSVTRIECRSTLCKVEFSHESNGGFKTFSQRLMLNPSGEPFPWSGEKMGGKLRVEKDGTVVSVMYLAREGSQIPRL